MALPIPEELVMSCGVLFALPMASPTARRGAQSPAATSAARDPEVLGSGAPLQRVAVFQ